MITPYRSSPENSCTNAYVDSPFDVTILAEREGGPDADLMDSVIRVVSVTLEGGTEEGVAIGDPVANMIATYGPPTTTHDEFADPGEQLLIFESRGFAYSALVGDGKIAVLESGDREWVGLGDPDGCQ